MADEIRSVTTVIYSDEDGVEASMDNDFYEDSAGKIVSKIVQTVGTSEEALDLGDVGTLRMLMVTNLDDTNYVNVKTGTGGAIVARLDPGQDLKIPIGSGMLAPFAIADTAACKVQILAVSA